jgi:uncharacterized Zn finger protein
MSTDENKTTKTSRLNNCAQCGETLFAPVWSEFVKERCIRHLWSCDACGYAYESMVYLAPTAKEQLDVAA